MRSRRRSVPSLWLTNRLWNTLLGCIVLCRMNSNVIASIPTLHYSTVRRRCGTVVPIACAARDGRPRFSVVAWFTIGTGRRPHFCAVARLANQEDGTLCHAPVWLPVPDWESGRPHFCVVRLCPNRKTADHASLWLPCSPIRKRRHTTVLCWWQVFPIRKIAHAGQLSSIMPPA